MIDTISARSQPTVFQKDVSRIFSHVVQKLDENGNGRIDVQRTYVLFKNGNAGAVKEYLLGRDAVPTGRQATLDLIRYENRGTNEVGDYLKKIAEGDFVFPNKLEPVRLQIQKDLKLALTAQEMKMLQISVGAASSINPFIPIAALTTYLLKKLAAMQKESVEEADWAKAARLP